MTALFGPEVEGEPFSPRNGLLLHDLIEDRLYQTSMTIETLEKCCSGARTQKAWKIK
jgi:hypothetical protein